MREGYKMTELGEIPEEWEIKSVDKIANVTTGNKDTQNKVEDGLYPFFVRSQTVERINSYSFDGESVLTAGDGVGVGKVFHYVNGKFDYHQRVYNIYGFNENVVGRYFFEYFKHNFISQVNKYNAKGSVDSVRMDMITKMKILLPVFAEQQEIAQVFTTVDEKIEVIETQITQTQELKKGLMQQLLTKGIGHTKFKDSPLGEIPESWKVVKLGDITIVNVGKDLMEKNYSLVRSEEYQYPVYSNTVSNKGLYGYYNIKEYTGKSVTVVGRGVGVGTCFPRVGTFGAIGRLIVLFPKTGLDSRFLCYYINFSVKFFTESSAIPQLTGTQIAGYNIVLPSLSEQEKIADVLCSVDDKLDILQLKKDTFTKMKKGLLQQLLTGKIRVKINQHV